MDLWTTLTLLLVGSVISVPASMVGLGGGFLIVPTLIILFGLPAQNAVAISLVAMCGTTLSATFAYMRQGRIDFLLGLLYDLLDLPGVVLGAYLTTLVSSNLLTATAGLFILFISALLFTRNKGASNSDERQVPPLGGKWKRKKVDSSGKIFKYELQGLVWALLSSFAGGFVTGLCGLGGGITDTSTMILLGVPPHIAAASSEFAMALTNGAGVVMHGLLNNILVEYALPITVGTIVGAQVGSSLAKHVNEKIIRRLLSAVAFVAGLRVILQALL